MISWNNLHILFLIILRGSSSVGVGKSFLILVDGNDIYSHVGAEACSLSQNGEEWKVEDGNHWVRRQGWACINSWGQKIWEEGRQRRWPSRGKNIMITTI